MVHPRILVAGVGNVFLGDDAFGVEVVRRLLSRRLAAGVRAVDYGIRGFDLACALMEGYDAVILVDATRRGGAPGTLYVIEPELDARAVGHSFPEFGGHSLSPERVMQWVLALGGRMPPLYVVGCEPATFGSDAQPQMGLSVAVADAVDRAIPLIESLAEAQAASLSDETVAGRMR
jgi:hydrogenase maturation protease